MSRYGSDSIHNAQLREGASNVKLNAALKRVEALEEENKRLRGALEEIEDCACASFTMNGQCTGECHRIASAALAKPQPADE